MLLAEETQFLSAELIEAVICNHEIDVDKTAMLNILMSCMTQDKDHLEVDKRLMAHIQLCHVKPDRLKYLVRKCRFVAATAVDAALREIEEALVKVAPEDQEHVWVTGAGPRGVGGHYVRLKNDIGMDEEEVMFVKEDDGGPDCSLILLQSTWAIALAVDISSLLYWCEVTLGLFLPRALKFGWRTVTGEDTAPTCTWNPSKADKLSRKPYTAPNLSRSFNRKSLANGD